MIGFECVVHLARRSGEVYKDPIEGRYSRAELIRPQAVLRPDAFPDVEVHVTEILFPYRG